MQTICYGNSSGYTRQDFVNPDLNWMVIEGDYRLFPDLKLISLPGHSAGTMGLMITLKNSGTIICPSDAVNTARHFERPVAMPGIIFDSINYNKSVEKLRQVAQEYEAQIVYTHDPDQKLKMAPSYYD